MILNDYMLQKSENDFLKRGKTSIKKAREIIQKTYSKKKEKDIWERLKLSEQKTILWLYMNLGGNMLTD